MGDLLAARDHVFLDFDGPVCTLFSALPASEAADRLKALLSPGLPDDIAASADPFEILAFAASCGPSAASVVERQLKRLELEAVSQATPGALDVIHDLARDGYTLTIVSNNSVDAVRAFLVMHDLAQAVRRISARVDGDVSKLKPSPFLIEQAIRGLGTSPSRCLMVGDSVADIEAARAAGVAVVAYANKPGKRERFAPYEPDVIIEDLATLR
ncbi:HAD family hydrolase [Amycolatopsis sp. cg5]|uniref:HAD family hydrolase n=1 Tax=Amycolatopsis sp. cg5 TaxID=3238802 RepID=UPI003525B8B3